MPEYGIVQWLTGIVFPGEGNPVKMSSVGGLDILRRGWVGRNGNHIGRDPLIVIFVGFIDFIEVINQHTYIITSRWYFRL